MRKTFQETVEHAKQLKYLKLDVSNYHLNGTEPEWEEVGKMHYLKGLNINNNQLTNLDCIANLTRLEYLEVAENKLHDANALNNLSNLKELVLNNNFLKDFDFLKSLSQLQYLDISGNSLNGTITKQAYIQAIEKIKSFVPHESGYESTLAYLSELQVSEQAKNIKCNLPALGKVIIKHYEDLRGELMQLMQYKISFAEDIRTLPVDTFENLQELRFLNMRSNFLIDIAALAKAKSLKKLFLAKNQIQDATPLNGLEKLETLDLTDNHVKDIMPLLCLPALKKLHISNNQIADLQAIGQASQLEVLVLSSNNIKHISLGFLLSLHIDCEVHLESNPIQNISKELLSKHKIVSSLIQILEKNQKQTT